MKPMFASEDTGSICIELSTHPEQRSISFLRRWRSANAAKALFSKSLTDRSHPQPRVINTDKARGYRLAISDAKDRGILGLPTSAGRVLEQHPGAGSPSHQETDLCQAAFPPFRLRTPNDTRLRDNSQDSERASSMVGEAQCSGGE